ncbi:MAG: hypothetical protein A2600_11480 [Candidatus Lambdaproteobacteria bacterium RIFOXYD1_FULL_56_27]|uniref:Tll0287-like domain-containing protein n=1 Tax=Candidatus Lambdaproteobacteria bacterium RIFOXYD2_FULL_56_26 TaxID=1817773 RepID=A0A1F6H0Y8_9PROT|nr:MAG: hypothetical protein A2557_11240 [Candidatus Lambdaproteobacteria bacterium RIFOXYD2_FULL_56_26]OGH08382.1 MAG: hypothetical protein A2600_11480 [Candidatus Lambdaproteobacteria bacterium RIFOXYD1_FULL_56_27]
MVKPFVPLLLLALLVGSAPLFAQELDQKILQSRTLFQGLSDDLQVQMWAAMSQGGPVAAIGTCNLNAGKVTEAASKQGVTLGRTSLKLRNPKNQPDPWERAMMEEFERQKASGVALEELEKGEFITQGGKKTFRYLKAIGTKPRCLACHGAVIAPEVEDKIKALYPNDLARGYKEGDLRGAFTLIQVLE